MEAILIKVAGIGLTVKHLGKSLAEMQQILVKLVSDDWSHLVLRSTSFHSDRINSTAPMCAGKVASMSL